MENLLKNIEELRERVLNTMRILEVERKKAEIGNWKLEIVKPGFWDDQERAVDISQRADEQEKEVKLWDDLSQAVRDLEEIVAESQELNDNSMEEDANRQYAKLKKEFEKLEFYVMFNGKYDSGNAIISIHAGTGGVDAQDWAQILERMFLRFCEKRNWKITLIDRSVGNEAGIKSAMYHIKGRYSYGYLQSESGVHRLVRISPFDGESLRQTSFALVEVIPDLPEAAEIELNESDLKIDVYRSSGPGGQGVNTTDSAVRITHLPSKIVVSCQNERSQHQNKETALKILKAKLFKIEEEKRQAEELKLRGETQKAEWGKQIRSYVMQPYKMVKDHRTDCETRDIDRVLDGGLEEFMESFLRWKT